MMFRLGLSRRKWWRRRGLNWSILPRPPFMVNQKWPPSPDQLKYCHVGPNHYGGEGGGAMIMVLKPLPVLASLSPQSASRGFPGSFGAMRAFLILPGKCAPSHAYSMYSRVEWFKKMLHFLWIAILFWTPIPKFHVLMLPFLVVSGPQKMLIVTLKWANKFFFTFSKVSPETKCVL